MGRGRKGRLRETEVAWLVPVAHGNPHDKAVVAWEKVAPQRDRGWAGENVVRSWGPIQAPLEEETSKLDRSICSKALWRGVLRGLLFYGARDWPRRAPQMMVFRLLSGLTQLFRKKTSLSLFLSPLAKWWFRCQRVRRNDQKQEKEITHRLRDESFPQLLFGPVSWFIVRCLLIRQ